MVKSHCIEMKVEFIIFAVTASLVQSSFGLPTDVTYGQSAEKLATFNNIIINQKKAVETSFDSVNPLYDLIEKYASELIYNLEYVASDDAVTDDSPNGLVDAILDGISLTFDTTISSVDEVRASLNTYLKNGFAAIDSALALATTGNRSANKAQLKAYRETAQDQLATFIQTLYNLIKSLANTSDEEVLAVIDLAQSRSANNVKLAINAAFNALDIYGAAVTAGTADLSLIVKIESYRENSLGGLEDHVEILFSLLRAHYINSQLSPSVDLAGLYSIQYSQIVSSSKFDADIEEYFRTIRNYLKKVALGLQDSGRSDFSPVDASQVKALAKITAGYEAFLDSILVIHPDAENAVANARATLSTRSTAVPTKVFEIIEAAQDPAITYSKCLRKIEASSEAGSYSTDSFVDTYLDLIRNGETWDSNSETEFNTLHDAAVDQLEASVYNVQDAIKTLAKAVDANVATESDFSAVSTAQAGAAAALDLFTQMISAAGVVQLKASASSTQNVFSKSSLANYSKNIFSFRNYYAG